MGCDAVGKCEQADNMLKQAAQPGVVQLLGGGGLAIGLREDRIGQESGKQQLEIWVGQALDKAKKLAPEGCNIVSG